MSRPGSTSRGCRRARWTAAARNAAVMDSNTLVAAVVLATGVLTLLLIGAGEAGVIAGVRERALREPAETRVEALRRFYQERQVTLSSLSLARNLASVGVTGFAT